MFVFSLPEWCLKRMLNALVASFTSCLARMIKCILGSDNGNEMVYSE